MVEEDIIQFHFDTKEPVEITDFVASLKGFADQYIEFVESRGGIDSEARLYIKEIRSGSIIADIISVYKQYQLSEVAAILKTSFEFVDRTKTVIDWFRGKKKESAPPPTKTEMENTKAILAPVVNDEKSSITINLINGPTVINNIRVDSFQAAAITKRIESQLASQRIPEAGTRQGKAFRWYQARNDLKAKTGDQGVIESISRKPVKTRMYSEDIKQRMTQGSIFSNTYIVDVEVETVDGRPVLYKILELREILPDGKAA